MLCLIFHLFGKNINAVKVLICISRCLGMHFMKEEPSKEGEDWFFSTSNLSLADEATYGLKTSAKWFLHDTKPLKWRFDHWSNFWCPHKLGEICLQSLHHIILFKGFSIWQKPRQSQFLWVPSVKLAFAHCCLLLRSRSFIKVPPVLPPNSCTFYVVSFFRRQIQKRSHCVSQTGWHCRLQRDSLCQRQKLAMHCRWRPPSFHQRLPHLILSFTLWKKKKGKKCINSVPLFDVGKKRQQFSGTVPLLFVPILSEFSFGRLDFTLKGMSKWCDGLNQAGWNRCHPLSFQNASFISSFPHSECQYYWLSPRYFLLQWD